MREEGGAGRARLAVDEQEGVAREQLGLPPAEGEVFLGGASSDPEDQAGAGLLGEAHATELGVRAAVLVEEAGVGLERIETLEQEEGAHHRGRPEPVLHRPVVPGIGDAAEPQVACVG